MKKETLTNDEAVEGKDAVVPEEIVVGTQVIIEGPKGEIVAVKVKEISPNRQFIRLTINGFIGRAWQRYSNLKVVDVIQKVI